MSTIIITIKLWLSVFGVFSEELHHYRFLRGTVPLGLKSAQTSLKSAPATNIWSVDHIRHGLHSESGRFHSGVFYTWVFYIQYTAES